MSDKFHRLTLGGLVRDLPILRLQPQADSAALLPSDGVSIAFFNILGDNELTDTAAAMLAPLLPECDFLVTAETKGIPIAAQLARVLDIPQYIVLRKTVKPYMVEPMTEEVYSITTQSKQILAFDAGDAALIANSRIIIIDDVISTGNSLAAIERIVKRCGGKVVAKAAILAEGDAAVRDDIVFLEKLPLF
ncbi:MAG: adenine phosphoribosyltransferase [Oscillospiraceae bacterium]|nr:adenine phosphoribosyltransferase [Oscillospiraceae bacterium]